ncbi:MAG: hypothetical protein HY401_04030 [Elusimicrobia bacterium]|nr:hypothetical protein [Elusimicrobiota bacterium]
MSSFLEGKYHLKRDPFPTNVATAKDPMVGRDKEYAAWQRIIKRCKGETANSLNFIIGDYGLGKTLALYKIQEYVLEDAKMQSIFMRLLPEDKISRFGQMFIQRIFSRIDFSKLRFAKAAVKTLEEVLPDEALVMRKAAEGDPLAIQLLRGEGSLNKAEMASLGVRKKIGSTEAAIRYWLSYLILLKSVGIDTVVLLIDEVEYLFSQMKGLAGVSMVFNTLRELHDLSNMPQPVSLPASNVVFFFAVSDDGWRNINMIQKKERSQGGPMNAFLRRISPPTTLKRLTQEEALQLIQLRLSEQRTGPKPSKPLIPFTDSFVAFIYELSAGVPHLVVSYCHEILRKGLEENVPMLTKDYAKKVLREVGLYVES